MGDAYAGLDPTFRAKLGQLEASCHAQGVIVKGYFGLRDPVTQGRLYRQSRDTNAIEGKIAWLRRNGAPYLADCLERAGPVPSGPWATNAAPGDSWHQFGEGMDYEWLVDGKVEWSTSLGGEKNGYHVLGHVALSLGLTPLGITMGTDWGHVQLRRQGAPHDVMPWQEIDAKMKAKFGHG